MATLQGLHADFFVTSGAAVAIAADTAMTDISANVPGQPVRTCYANSVAAQRYFDLATPLVVQTSPDGVTWTTDTNHFQEAGFVRWASSLPVGEQVRILSGKYLPYAHLGGSHEWTLTPSVALIDITEFGDVAKKYQSAMMDATASCKHFWIDDTMRSTMGNLMVLALFVHGTSAPAGPRYECLAFLKDDGIKVSAAGVIEEALNFQIQSPAGLTNPVWFLSN